MNTKIILLDKPPGYTPLQALEQFKEQFPQYKQETLSYAGRLDPMAQGLLIILVGEENKNRQKYIDLPKTYEFEILVGVSTDTHDVMGNIIAYNTLTENIPDLYVKKGRYPLAYPAYSSKTVCGKPLFWYAKNNLLQTIDIPIKEAVIYDCKKLSSRSVHDSIIYDSIKRRIAITRGDFRQKEILEGWKKFFERKQTLTMQIIQYTTHVSSGTYVRAIIHELEKQSGIPLLAYTIKRTKIGAYSLEDAIRIDVNCSSVSSTGNTPQE
jgi:tRNA pseudouridine55 synthase